MQTSDSTYLASLARLHTLRRTGLLDSLPEELYERFVRLAARLTGSPTALISLVDEHRQFFKSTFGLHEPWASMRQTPLTHSFCQHVVTTGETLNVQDARTDARVRDNLAVSEIGVVSYLGSPIFVHGECLGPLCVIDSRPRQWSADDQQALEDLAGTLNHVIEKQVTELFSQRLADLIPAVVYLQDLESGQTLFVNKMGEDYDVSPLTNLSASRDSEQEIRLQRQDGGAHWFMHRRVPLTTVTPQILGLATDIQASKRLELQLRQAMQSKADLIAQVSHELRTPLQGILGASELALDLAYSDEIRELIQGAHDCAVSLHDIVNQLLKFHEVENEAALSVREIFCLSTRLQGLRSEFTSQRARLEFPVLEPLWIEGDWGKMRQILVNLIGNALKYSGDKPVRLELEVQPSTLSFTVADLGPGLAAQDLESVFRPFVRLSATQHLTGTGLGLFVARRMAESLDGSLTAVSQPGQGSRFTFALPHRTANMPAPTRTAVAPSLPAYDVLVVDDNAMVRVLYLKMLETMGQRVAVAENGQQAIDLARGQEFDLVLLDLQLPTSTALRSLASCAGVPRNRSF